MNSIGKLQSALYRTYLDSISVQNAAEMEQANMGLKCWSNVDYLSFSKMEKADQEV